MTAHTNRYTPLGLEARHSAGDAADGDAGPRTVLTIRFGDAVLYLYESLLTRRVLVVDVEDAEPQPAGVRLVIGGDDAFTTGAGAMNTSRTSSHEIPVAVDPPTTSPPGAPMTDNTLRIADGDLPHLLAALDIADAVTGWSFHGLLATESDRELGRLRRDALRRIRAEASRG